MFKRFTSHNHLDFAGTHLDNMESVFSFFKELVLAHSVQVGILVQRRPVSSTTRFGSAMNRSGSITQSYSAACNESVLYVSAVKLNVCESLTLIS